MDPITVIVTALVAGAAAGGADAASMAVRDAYTGIRDRIRVLASGSDTDVAIEANEAAPGSNVNQVREVLAREGVAGDEQLQITATELLSLLPTEAADEARARVDVRGAQGVQLGNYNTQHNIWH